jgi:hypothetical protein
MAEDDMSGDNGSGGSLAMSMGGLQARTRDLTGSANTFARAMTRAFMQASVGGKQLDDVLKGLALRLSSMAVAKAFNPFAATLTSGFGTVFSGVFGGQGNGGGPSAGAGAVAGGNAMPGAAMTGSAAPNVNVHISTPDLGSFRRSEAYVTGQIARAVARGQRSL